MRSWLANTSKMMIPNLLDCEGINLPIINSNDRVDITIKAKLYAGIEKVAILLLDPVDQSQYAYSKYLQKFYQYVNLDKNGVAVIRINNIKSINLRPWQRDLMVYEEIIINEVNLLSTEKNDSIDPKLSLQFEVSCCAGCFEMTNRFINIIEHYQENPTNHLISDGVSTYQQVDLSLAMLDCREDDASYLKRIGVKSRNMLKKAHKNGYQAAVISSYEETDDLYQSILNIRTSSQNRQGKELPEYFKKKPEYMIPSSEELNCKIHNHKLMIINDLQGRVVAYSTFYLLGEVGLINHFLVHNEHMNGVSNFLIYSIRKYINEIYKDVKFLNYMRLTLTNKSGLDRFKDSMGFLPLKFYLRTT